MCRLINLLRELLIILCTFNFSVYAALEPIDYSKNAILSPCVLSLCEKYFKSKFISNGALAIINLVPNPSIFQALALKEMNEDENHKLSLMIKDAKKPHSDAKRVTERAKNYLMMLSNTSDLSATLNQLRSLPTWNPLAEVVVLFTRPMISVEEQLQMSREVFEELFAYSMINVNAIYQYQKNPYEFEVVTWFPYFNKSCADRIENIRKIDECIMKENLESNAGKTKNVLTLRVFNQEMYPKIPKDFHRCPLKVTTYIWNPYVIGDNEIIERGFEAEIVKEIATKLNLNLTFKLIDPKRATTLTTSNNETGFYADLFQKRADLMIGGLAENAISTKYLSSSIHYFQDDITWCVKTAEIAPMWLNVFLIFNKMTWIGFFITLFVIAIILNVYARHEGKRKDNFMWAFLITLSISTMQYGHYWPQRSSIKLFLAILMIFGLHINTAYRSYLISVLTQPRFEAQIETIQDAFDKNLVFKMDENLAYFLRMKNDSESNQILRNHAICKDIKKCFGEMSKNKSIALAVSREHALHNEFGLDDDDFFCFSVEENIVSYTTVMKFQRFHHLLSIFNRHIRSVIESGMMDNWYHQSKSVKMHIEHAKHEAETTNLAHSTVNVLYLRLEHVEGSFLIIFIGFIVAILVFIIERIISTLSHGKGKNSKLKLFEDFIFHTKN